MSKTLWTAALFFAIAVFSFPVLADPPPPSYPPDLDLSAGVWQVFDGANNTVSLFNDGAGSLYLDVPVEPDTTCKSTGSCDTINYLFTTHVPTIISGMIVITLRADTTDEPVFHHTSTDPLCTNVPAVRALIWSKNQSGHDGYRWWANPHSYVLGPGAVTITIPIDPRFWSGVSGHFANENNQYLQQFQRAIEDASSLGVTFGGGCAFGHGVFMVSGTARFTLENYEVAPTPNCPAVTPCNGNSCLEGAVLGDTNTALHQCLDGSTLNECNFPDSFHVLDTNCFKAPCCTATPFPCICPIGSCPQGSKLVCQSN